MAEQKDRIRVHIDGKEFTVVGGKFQDMLGAVKQISGRRFVGELKVWQLPGPADNIQNQLEISGYWLEGGTPVTEKDQPAPSAAPRPGGDRIRVTVQGHQLAVVGGTFQDMLTAVKNLPGRRFDGESKVWEIPGEVVIIKQLVETAGFQLEGADKIPLGPVSDMEQPDFGPSSEPPPAFEEPLFFDSDEMPPYEPPDWWDDDAASAPPPEPPDWTGDEMAPSPDELTDFDTGVKLALSSPPAEMPRSAQTTQPAPASLGRDQIRIRVGGILLMVSGGTFKEMLEVIKKIPGRRFDGTDKTWDIPGDIGIDSVQQTVKAAGFLLDRG